MSRTGICVLAGLVTLASVAFGRTDAQLRSSTASGKIAVSDTAGAILILAADNGRVLARIRSNGSAVDLSPDGRWLAHDPYPAGLVVQPVSGGRARTVARCSTKWCPGWPSWERTGFELAYEQGQFVYKVLANGRARTRVIRGETPDWSPRTPEIAFVRDYSYDTHAGKIYVAATDGRDVRYITRGAYPAFHPSGKRLAFDLGRDIYTVPVAGGKPRRIIRNGFSPIWSPDGRFIAFDRYTSCGHAVCSGRVFIVRASGGKPRAIGPEIADIGRISWSR